MAERPYLSLLHALHAASVMERNLIAFSLFHPHRVMEEVDILVGTAIAWSEVQTSLIFRPISGTPVAVIGRGLLKK